MECRTPICTVSTRGNDRTDQRMQLSQSQQRHRKTASGILRKLALTGFEPDPLSAAPDRIRGYNIQQIVRDASKLDALYEPTSA